jgi:hypothetical protein
VLAQVRNQIISFFIYLYIIKTDKVDKLTSLSLSFDRVLIQLIIPGLIAIFPWFIYFLGFHFYARKYFHDNSTITLTAVTLLALIAGIFLENIGSRIEVFWLDKLNARKFENYDNTWHKYLQISYAENEPIGQRYIRNILLRMKFELSTAVAIIPMSIGLIFVNYARAIFGNCCGAILLLYIVPFVLIVYLLYEARSSSEVLARTRNSLVDKYYRKDFRFKKRDRNKEP